MVTFSGRVTLPDGTAVPASGSVSITAKMLVGLDFPNNVTEQATHLALYPGVTGPARIFAPPGSGLPAWTSNLLSALPAAWVPHVSFKDFPTRAVFDAWLTAMPSTWREVWITYHHEPEGDLEAALYRSQWQQLWSWVNAHPKRPKIKAIPIHTLYWSRHKGDWHLWWPGVGDMIGFDCYDEGGRYEAPASIFSIPFAAATEVGLPLIVPELGAILPLKTDGTRDTTKSPVRAAWITSSVSYLKTHGCRSVAWWCSGSESPTTLNYHLDTYPLELAAWRAAIAESH